MVGVVRWENLIVVLSVLWLKLVKVSGSRIATHGGDGSFRFISTVTLNTGRSHVINLLPFFNGFSFLLRSKRIGRKIKLRTDLLVRTFPSLGSKSFDVLDDRTQALIRDIPRKHGRAL